MTDAMFGAWEPGALPPVFDQRDILQRVASPRQPLMVIREVATGRFGLAQGGRITSSDSPDYTIVATLGALYPEWLGDRGFCEAHGVRFPYVAGAMANGIATADMVIAMARAGMLGFFGAAGLGYEKVVAGIDRIIEGVADMPGASWGANLIHSPNEPMLEDRVAQLFIERGVKRVSASAYMKLTPSIVWYAYKGVKTGPSGQILRDRYVFAKISRQETARHFMNPAPEAMLRDLVERGRLTADEARLAEHLPVAEDITAESDSGGHTDNRPLAALFPDVCAARDEVMQQRQYTRPIRVGAAGGLGTPGALAGAFSMGAAYVLTGSVNQSALEAGLSKEGKAMLALAGLTDVIMAPAADMFELGVEVQVLRRGTMFGTRAQKLHHYYTTYPSLDAIPAKEREQLEKRVLGESIANIWADTARFWGKRDPAEVERAERDPKHKMALVFRWYLGKASKWAIDGESGRGLDYQIWCGPAMGAFNTWVKGSFLEDPANREVAQIALNLLEGAAVITRAQQLRTLGVPVPAGAFDFRPRPLR